MNRINFSPNTRIILNEVVDANATQGTEPYKQSRTYKMPHFTCLILLYTEQN
uniref:Uncharacterized protein n=1 Tax=Solanum lycopersicum TaxID=4081 RepID=A0A3Q7HA10_SOLLC